MRIQYTTEKEFRGVEHIDVYLAKEPSESVGQKIEILYSSENPSVIMTADNRESKGIAGFGLRIFTGVLIFFAIVLTVFYYLGKYGLLDD